MADPEGPEEREWDDPAPAAELARATRFRVAGGLVGLAVGLVVFRGTLLAVLPRLWPPGGPRWFTLVLVTALSLTLPLMVGAALGEALARR
ncbi:MAG: hypothetical protein V5A61_01690 [Haloarculaceae archaeon]|jgi:hypothetical protein